ncbi:AraC family transcriptional regulator [Piscinibacter sp. HJYY11]|uniref:helix-turn-helix domain-containing protein n=1 Tax=Piscinibacter sp. HJYY11 TaxID=2801333 RepID=UPI00191D7E1D|nr:helix-turn-helix domain-containing protein [Piscinibacter sp. HJYY11]MBL0727283.1 AraC family transcriptional regulator [Piscinibacter sp. HJYY11]
MNTAGADVADGARGAVRSHAIEVTGALRPYVSALMAAEMSATGPMPLAIAPHESMMLSVQMGIDSQVEQKGRLGENTALTGIRQWTGTFVGAGNCITLFALLTPLGLVHLLESRQVDKIPRIRAPVAALLDGFITRGLESDVAVAPTLQDKLQAFGSWLEERATAHRQQSTAALRAARAAMRICAEPEAAIESLADEQHVSRRQLERDFGQWIGTSPRHLSQVARLQAVSRRAQAGASLADIAADLGFADQAHMSRVVRQLTGLTPRSFVKSRQSPMATTWRRATAGGTVYL